MPTELRYDAETGETKQVPYTPAPAEPSPVTMTEDQIRSLLSAAGLTPAQIDALMQTAG